MVNITEGAESFFSSFQQMGIFWCLSLSKSQILPKEVRKEEVSPDDSFSC